MLRRLELVFTVVVGVWIVMCLVVFVWPRAATGAPAHADAIVMLSGDHRRLAPAEALVRRGVAPVLALSSIQITPTWPAADRLCRRGRYAGARVLCFVARPYSTRGEAETVRRIAAQRHWHSIVVVSSTYHLTRASILFHRCLRGRLSFVGAPSPWWQLPYQWAAETAKLAVQLTVERGC